MGQLKVKAKNPDAPTPHITSLTVGKLSTHFNTWWCMRKMTLWLSLCLEVCVYLVREFEEKCLTEWALNYWAVAASKEGLHTEAEESALIWGYMLLANTQKPVKQTHTHIKPKERTLFFLPWVFEEASIFTLWTIDEDGREKNRDYRCLTPGLHIWQATALFMHFSGVYYSMTPLLSCSLSVLSLQGKQTSPLGYKLPKGQKTSADPSSSPALFSAVRVFSSRTWPPMCFLLSTSL